METWGDPHAELKLMVLQIYLGQRWFVHEDLCVPFNTPFTITGRRVCVFSQVMSSQQRVGSIALAT